MRVLRIEGHIGHLTWSILENPKNIVSYQASSSYNLEEFPRVITQCKHIKGKENKVVDALNKNAIKSFVASISDYKIDLEDKMEEGIKKDLEYQNLKEKITQNTYEI